MREFWLIRHTAVDNPLNLCYGQSEIPLRDNFSTALDQISAKLSLIQESEFLIFSSPLQRTLKLTQALGFKNIIPDPRILELNFGDWEGIPWSKIPIKILNKWMWSYLSEQTPHGESYSDLSTRVKSFIKNLDHRNALIFTHAGPIRVFLSYFFKIHPTEVINWNIPYGGIWKIKLPSKGNPFLEPPKGFCI